eukprot:m.333791 g.333791  ORF g.333791 m.333791 type:complete len:321 (-) comp17223_c0_seq1:105-1067(-)
MFSKVLQVLCFATVAVSQPLPALPDQFEAWIQCNIVNKNYTVNIHEIYDYPGNRALLSRYHGGLPGDDEQGYSKTLYLYDYGEYIHTNSTSCDGGPINQAGRGPGFGRNPNRIETSQELFAFGNGTVTRNPGQTEVYMGYESVNGVQCERWWSNITMVVPMGPAGTMVMSMDLDYYFTGDNWLIPQANATKIPHMLNLAGNRTIMYANGTNDFHTFHHYYLYAGFHVGPPRQNSWFTVEKDKKCTGNLTFIPYEEPENSKDGKDDDKFSLTILIVVAVATAIVVHLFTCLLMIMCKRNSGSSMPKQPTFNNPNSNTDSEL